MSLDPAELRRLREELQSADPARKESAVRRLTAMVHASAPGVLLDALGSDSVEVRQQASQLLDRMAESGDPSLEAVVTTIRGFGAGA